MKPSDEPSAWKTELNQLFSRLFLRNGGERVNRRFGIEESENGTSTLTDVPWNHTQNVRRKQTKDLSRATPPHIWGKTPSSTLFYYVHSHKAVELSRLHSHGIPMHLTFNTVREVETSSINTDHVKWHCYGCKQWRNNSSTSSVLFMIQNIRSFNE